MGDKVFKSVDEQLALLQSRNLTIDDLPQAADFLRFHNYYRISGYTLTLRSNDVFSSTASFREIMEIYRFDHSLRHILLTHIETIEVAVKSVYAHEFSRLYGPDGYLDASHFSDRRIYDRVINKVEEQKKTRLPHEAYLKHFVEEKQENIPLWAYVDLMTISDISFLYTISEESLKWTVADAFDLHTAQASSILGKYMHSMTILRNLCAHGGRLFNRLFEQKPSLNKRELALLRKKADGAVDNAHLFGFILIMRRILKPEDFETMKAAILELKKKYPLVEMRHYGFCDDWEAKL